MYYIAYLYSFIQYVLEARYRQIVSLDVEFCHTAMPFVLGYLLLVEELCKTSTASREKPAGHRPG